MIQIVRVAYHRNGVGGAGFHVGLATCNGDTLVIVRFGKEADAGAGQDCCAVLNVDKLASGNIRFGENSYRGDQFVAEMDAAIAKYEKEGR